jgi:hypothetical protein
MIDHTQRHCKGLFDLVEVDSNLDIVQNSTYVAMLCKLEIIPYLFLCIT